MQLKNRARVSILKICSFENKPASKPVFLFLFHLSEDQKAKTKPPSPKLSATSIVSSKKRPPISLIYKSHPTPNAGENNYAVTCL